MHRYLPKLLVHSFLACFLVLACTAGCSRPVVMEDTGQPKAAAPDRPEDVIVHKLEKDAPPIADSEGGEELSDSGIAGGAQKSRGPKKPFAPAPRKSYSKKRKSKSPPMENRAAAREMERKQERDKDKADSKWSRIKADVKGVAWKDRYKVKTAHFDVQCNVSKEVTRHYGKVLEALYKRYSKVFAALEPRRHRTVVYIFRNEEEFGFFCDASSYDEAKSAKGVYDPKLKEIICYHEMDGGKWLTCSVLARQLCYDFQVRFGNIEGGKLPRWSSEGLAALFEGVEISKDFKVSLTGPRKNSLAALKKDADNNQHVTVKKMLNAGSKEWDSRHDNTAGSFVWWLLKDSKKKKYKNLYERYLLGILKGKSRSPGSGDFIKVVEEVTGKTIEDLEAEWREYVQDMKLPGDDVVGQERR
ncbi:MAG: hypothetical protein E3J72_13410 [Planctomycetota bacterium]|nr:MAG: hypothetical protein E3J72_13410 [Planctomycetota bacterium]